MISKDVLSTFDPAVKSVSVKDEHIHIMLEFNTSVLTFTEQELSILLQELISAKETNRGS